MTKKGRKYASAKYYAPSSVIEDFIKEKLQNLKTGTSDTNLNRRKITFLEKIFQSMADLTYFLEQVAINPKLEESFRTDLQDLFDMRPESDAKQLHPYYGEDIAGIKLKETTFTRLIFASILPDDDEFLEYRLRMMHTLQSIVYAKTKFAMEANFGAYNQVTKSCLSDLSNAVGWTAMIGKHEIDPEYEPKRLLDFSAPFNKFYLKK